MMNFGHICTRVVTLDVLPSVAYFTKNSVAIVVWKAADAGYDRVVFFDNGLGKERNTVQEFCSRLK
jgi:hypothetical protein